MLEHIFGQGNVPSRSYDALNDQSQSQKASDAAYHANMLEYFFGQGNVPSRSSDALNNQSQSQKTSKTASDILTINPLVYLLPQPGM